MEMVWMPWRRLQLGSTHRHFLDRICSGIPACFPNIFRPPGAALSRGPGTCSTNQVRFVSSRSTVEDECSAVEYSKRYAHQARACTAQHDTCIDTIGTICTYAPFLERYCPAWMVLNDNRCKTVRLFLFFLFFAMYLMELSFHSPFVTRPMNFFWIMLYYWMCIYSVQANLLTKLRISVNTTEKWHPCTYCTLLTKHFKQQPSDNPTIRTTLPNSN